MKAFVLFLSLFFCSLTAEPLLFKEGKSVILDFSQEMTIEGFGEVETDILMDIGILQAAHEGASFPVDVAVRLKEVGVYIYSEEEGVDEEIRMEDLAESLEGATLLFHLESLKDIKEKTGQLAIFDLESDGQPYFGSSLFKNFLMQFFDHIGQDVEKLTAYPVSLNDTFSFEPESYECIDEYLVNRVDEGEVASEWSLLLQATSPEYIGKKAVLHWEGSGLWDLANPLLQSRKGKQFLLEKSSYKTSRVVIEQSWEPVSSTNHLSNWN